mmetsp:Transcript_79105/g.175347  ORF Transcript_79105/g.175347 Transcript_79105/m.175347 type:complete len:1100 (+) Transcript_79105:77-3376(+)
MKVGKSAANDMSAGHELVHDTGASRGGASGLDEKDDFKVAIAGHLTSLCDGLAEEHERLAKDRERCFAKDVASIFAKEVAMLRHENKELRSQLKRSHASQEAEKRLRSTPKALAASEDKSRFQDVAVQAGRASVEDDSVFSVVERAKPSPSDSSRRVQAAKESYSAAVPAGGASMKDDKVSSVAPRQKPPSLEPSVDIVEAKESQRIALASSGVSVEDDLMPFFLQQRRKPPTSEASVCTHEAKGFQSVALASCEASVGDDRTSSSLQKEKPLTSEASVGVQEAKGSPRIALASCGVAEEVERASRPRLPTSESPVGIDDAKGSERIALTTCRASVKDRASSVMKRPQPSIVEPFWGIRETNGSHGVVEPSGGASVEDGSVPFDVQRPMPSSSEPSEVIEEAKEFQDVAIPACGDSMEDSRASSNVQMPTSSTAELFPGAGAPMQVIEVILQTHPTWGGQQLADAEMRLAKIGIRSTSALEAALKGSLSGKRGLRVFSSDSLRALKYFFLHGHARDATVPGAYDPAGALAEAGTESRQVAATNTESRRATGTASVRSRIPWHLHRQPSISQVHPPSALPQSPAKQESSAASEAPARDARASRATSQPRPRSRGAFSSTVFDACRLSMLRKVNANLRLELVALRGHLGEMQANGTKNDSRPWSELFEALSPPSDEEGEELKEPATERVGMERGLRARSQGPPSALSPGKLDADARRIDTLRNENSKLRLEIMHLRRQLEEDEDYILQHRQLPPALETLPVVEAPAERQDRDHPHPCTPQNRMSSPMRATSAEKLASPQLCDRAEAKGAQLYTDWVMRGLEASEEPRRKSAPTQHRQLREILFEAQPKMTAQDLSNAELKLAQVGITSAAHLAEALKGQLNKRLREAGLKTFTAETVRAMRRSMSSIEFGYMEDTAEEDPPSSVATEDDDADIGKEGAKLLKERAEKDADQMRKSRFESIQQRLLQCKVWCKCGLPVHAGKCHVYGVGHEPLWPGAGEFLSKADLDWFVSMGGQLPEPPEEELVLEDSPTAGAEELAGGGAAAEPLLVWAAIECDSCEMFPLVGHRFRPPELGAPHALTSTSASLATSDAAKSPLAKSSKS